MFPLYPKMGYAHYQTFALYGKVAYPLQNIASLQKLCRLTKIWFQNPPARFVVHWENYTLTSVLP